MAIEDVEARLLALAKDYDPLKRDTVITQDPFYGAYTQTNRMRAYCEVWIDGVDITYKLDPHLVSVRIVEGDTTNCEIEIDDRDGRLPIPPMQALVEVRLGWARELMIKTFEGRLESLEHGFGRKQGGRRMWVKATGWDVLGTKIKQPMDANDGAGVPPGETKGKEIPLTDWVKKIVNYAGGVPGSINPFFEKIKRDHWAMMNASPLHQITQLGQEFGAMVQWTTGNKLDWRLPGELGISVRAVWRDNLIGWRVQPWLSRTAYDAVQAQFFDPKTGAWVRRILDVAGVLGPGKLAAAKGAASPGPAATFAAAGQQNDGAASDGIGYGTGRIVINGEPAAKRASIVTLVGARPGVDGDYTIWVAEHIYSRQGYITWLDVKPHVEAKGGSNVLDSWPLPRPNPNKG